MDIHEARQVANALAVTGAMTGRDRDALRVLCASTEDSAGTTALMAKALAAQAETITALGDQVVQLARNPTA